MISLRRANERHHSQLQEREAWQTFAVDAPSDSPVDSFGALEALSEIRLPPGMRIPAHPRREGELLTYVREGALAYEDAVGDSGVIYAGEFQHRTTGRGAPHREANASSTDWAHVFQIRVKAPIAALHPDHEQKRFFAADRRYELCVVASPDARGGSMRIHQDALIYANLAERGQHVVHEIAAGRSAWLHVVQGAITLGDFVLTTGDGAGATGERAVSYTAREESEVLLLDLAGTIPPGVTRGVTHIDGE